MAALVGGLVIPSTFGCGGAATLAEPLGYADPVSMATSTRPTSVVASDAPWSMRAVASHDRRLWILTDAARLVAIRMDDGGIEQAGLPSQHIVDVRRTAGDRLWALTLDEVTGDTRVWERGAKEWTPIFEMMTASRPLALGELGGRPVVVSARALAWEEKDSVESMSIDAHLSSEGARRQVVTIGRRLYVGVDARFAGGLLYADLTAHTSKWIEATDRLEGCSGTFDPACDRVTGVATHPVATGCALVAVTRNDGGKPHRRGRLLEVCEDEVRRVDGLFADLEPTPNATLALAAFHGGTEDADTAVDDGRLTFPFSSGGDPATELAPLDLGPDPTARTIERLCSIDPEACRSPQVTFDDPVDPSVVALADAPDGVWLSTEDRLVFWAANGTLTSAQPLEENVGGAFVYARSDVVWAAPLRDAGRAEASLARLAVPATVLSGGGAHDALRIEDVSVGCYRALGDADVDLCFGRNAYVIRDRDGIDAGDFAAWKPSPRHPRLGREILLPGKQSVWVSATEGGAQVSLLRRVDGHVVSAELARLDADAGKKLRADLGEVPDVAAVCAKARACVRALPDGDWDSAPLETEIKTLRACREALRRTRALFPTPPPDCEE